MLKQYLRFSDLQDRGIADNRQSLNRAIRDAGFPQGIRIGPRQRIWEESAVEIWMNDRPPATYKAAEK